MKKQSFYWEIRDLVAQFTDAFNDIVINRYNENKVPEDQLHVNFVYAPKSRVLHDLVNKAGHIKPPIVSVFISNVRRAPNRVFNKIEGPYYTLSHIQSGYEKLLQPVPVDITLNMSIVTRFQQDLDQILSNWAPWNDPYVVVSWQMPITELEIRSHIIWDGNININTPHDTNATEFYRQTADTTFTIEGWLFKKPDDPVGKIYKITTTFNAVSDIMDNFEYLESMADPYNPLNTEIFVISARPQLYECTPYATLPCVSGRYFTLYGKMFDWVTSLYASGGTGVYDLAPTGWPVSAVSGIYTMFYDPASSNARISAYYPGFSAVEIATWSKSSDTEIQFMLPVPVSAGFIDIIAFNEAGYGLLSRDSVRTTFNPYPSTAPEYNTWVSWQPPYISGIEVLPIYDYC